MLEGTSEWSPTNGDTPSLVNGGEKVVTKDDYTSEIAEFSPAEELARWSETGQHMIIASLKEQGIVVPGITDTDSTAETETGAVAESIQPQENTSYQSTDTDTDFAYSSAA